MTSAKRCCCGLFSVTTGASIIGSLTLLLSVLALGVIVLTDSHKWVPPVTVQYKVLGGVIVSACALSGLGVVLGGSTRRHGLYLPFLALQASETVFRSVTILYGLIIGDHARFGDPLSNTLTFTIDLWFLWVVFSAYEAVARERAVEEEEERKPQITNYV